MVSSVETTLLKFVVALNYFSVRLNNVSSSDVVNVENMISKVQFIFDDFSAQTTFDELGDSVNTDGVVDGTAKDKVVNESSHRKTKSFAS
jgi:hypothetical protein